MNKIIHALNKNAILLKATKISLLDNIYNFVLYFTQRLKSLN